MVVLPQAMILNSSERAVVEERVADRASWLDIGQTSPLARSPRSISLLSMICRAWSVRNALRKWIRGESPKLDGRPHDFDWRPPPATLRRLAQMELAPIKREMVQLEKLLILSRGEFSDEHRAEMRARFAELLKTLQAN
jgi:hypothetical protein